MFEKILTEKCICFWIQPSAATVNAIEMWQGPVPVVRQLKTMLSTPTASIVRKGLGLPAIPIELLQGLCNATRGGGEFPVPGPDRDKNGVRQDICQNVTYSFEFDNETMNVCDLQWEPRAAEEAIARCVLADYLKKPEPTDDGFQDNSRKYTYNTTLEWWKEYTTLPPFNHMDFSRRKVNAYYTYDGCEACGMCSRLRLDSRNFENIEVPCLQIRLLCLCCSCARVFPVLSLVCLNVNTGPLVVFQVSRQMPARLFQNEILTMHLKTVNNDWRLDEYEARNVGFWMDLQVFPDLLLPILSYCAFLQLTCANTIADVCNQEYSGPPSCHGYWDGCRFLRFDQQRFHKSRELAKQTILGSNLYQHGGQGVRIWANGKCFRGAAVPSLERKGHRPDGLLEV